MLCYGSWLLPVPSDVLVFILVLLFTDTKDHEKNSGHILIAIVASAVVAVVLIVCITVIVLYKKKSRSKQSNIEQPNSDATQQQKQQPKSGPPQSILLRSSENNPGVNITMPTPHGNQTLENHNQHNRRPSNASGISSQDSVGYGSYCSSRCPLQMACHCTHHMHSQHSFNGSCYDHAPAHLYPHHPEGYHTLRANSCCDGCRTFQGTSFQEASGCMHPDASHTRQSPAPSNQLPANQQPPPPRKTAVFPIRRNSSDPNISRHTQQSSRLLDQTTINRTISSSSAL